MKDIEPIKPDFKIINKVKETIDTIKDKIDNNNSNTNIDEIKLDNNEADFNDLVKESFNEAINKIESGEVSPTSTIDSGSANSDSQNNNIKDIKDISDTVLDDIVNSDNRNKIIGFIDDFFDDLVVTDTDVKNKEFAKQFFGDKGLNISSEKIKSISESADGSAFVYFDNGNILHVSSSGNVDTAYTNNGKIAMKLDKNYDIIETFYQNDSGHYDEFNLDALYENGINPSEIELVNDNNSEKQVKMKLENGTFISKLDDGSIVVFYPNGIKSEYDSNGSFIKSWYVNGESSNNIDIFDDYNLDNFQYGGNQMDFKYDIEDLLSDPKIIKDIKKYFPGATEEECEMYLYKICNTGCGYTAFVNSIFKEYEGQEEKFLKDFGFNMYTTDKSGNIDYNYEYLILEYFSYVWGNNYDIDALIKGITKDVNDGSLTIDDNKKSIKTGTNDKRANKFDDFLKSQYHLNNINVDTSWYNTKDLNTNNAIDVYKSLKNNDNQIILSLSDFDLYPLTDNNKPIYDVGPHAMYITGITDDNRFIVSSWGKKYIVDMSNVESNNGHIGFYIVNYNN